jgi:hypothetical protein
MLGRGGLVVVLVMVLFGVLAPVAGAAEEAQMQALLNADGSAKLFANDPAESFSWEACDVSLTTCSPAGTGRELNVAGAPDGTIFKLNETRTGYSPVWHGDLKILAPPSVTGELRAGEVVTPVPATWQGGWEGDYDQTQLAACATPAGEGCTSITDTKYVGGCANGGAVIDPSFGGDYLRVADEREGPGTATTLEATLSPYGHPIWPAQGNTAVAIAGQIGPALRTSSPSCGPEALVEAWISSSGVAKVSCALGCEATLVARHGHRAIHKARLVAATGLPGFLTKPNEVKPSGTSLRLPHGLLKRLGSGHAKFAVEVGGERFASRSVNLASHRKRSGGRR